MLISRNTLFLGSTLCALALASACGGGSEDPKTVAETKTAHLRGRLAASERAHLQDAALTAYRIGATGALTAVTHGDAKLDADGRYDLTVDVTAGAIDAVLVRAELGAARASVLASAPLSASKTVTLAPMDAETTAEADVHVAALAVAADHRAIVQRDLVRALVTPELASALAAGNYTVDVRTTARALVAGLTARAVYLQSDAGGVSAEQLALVAQRTTSAQLLLDAALDAATSTTTEAAAHAGYQAAIEAALENAAIFAEERAAARQAFAEALRPYAATASATLRPALLATAELDRVAEVTAHVEAELQALGLVAAETKVISDAAAALDADVRAALAARAEEVDAKVEAAWSSYASTIAAELELSLPLAQRVKYLEVQLAIAGAGVTLGSDLGGLTSVAAPYTTGIATAAAVAGYRAAVLSDTNLTALMAANLEGDEARAITEVLYTLGVATEGRGVTAE